MSLSVFFIDFSGYEFHIVVEAEDGAGEQEGLGFPTFSPFYLEYSKKVPIFAE